MGQSAQKISKVNHDELLDVLNRAYGEEWLAYYQYWIGSQIISGPMRVTVQEEFMKHAKEELEHAGWLATRIIQLGGTPLLNPAEWMEKARCAYETPSDEFVLALLEQNLDSERCAIARYQQICEMCFGKDFETFKISEKILHEELDHEQDWEDFIKDLQEGADYAKKAAK